MPFKLVLPLQLRPGIMSFDFGYGLAMCRGALQICFAQTPPDGE